MDFSFCRYCFLYICNLSLRQADVQCLNTVHGCSNSKNRNLALPACVSSNTDAGSAWERSYAHQIRFLGYLEGDLGVSEERGAANG